MTAITLLTELWERGVHLHVEGERLRYRAPKGVVTPELLSLIAEHKQELIALLRRRDELLAEAPPLVARAREGKTDFPLSFAQERLWFIDQLEPGNPAYNISAAVRFKGDLNVGALERSLDEIVARHEALRTAFTNAGDQPVQRISPRGPLSLRVVDLRARPEETREAAAQQLFTEEARTPFDLSVGNLLRTLLVRLGDDDHVLSCTMHHIVSDRWSIRVLLRELSALYEAFSAGRPSPLPELPLQYADFAAWQREWLRGAVFENQSAYWKQRLSGAPPVLELPTDNLRPAVQGHRGARQLFELSKPLSDALAALSRRLDVTPYMMLLAAFKALLHRYSGQTDIVVGCPIAGRGRTEVEGLIGFFLNTLALRTDASGDPAFDEFARRVRDVTLGAYTHQDIPFEKVVEELQPERDLSHTPIFQVMFVFQSFQRVGAELPGLTLEPVRVESGTTMFDLTLSLTQESDNRVSGFFRYNTDLFERATAERIVDDFTALLEGIVADPSRRLSELPLIPEEALAKYYGRGKAARPSNPFREFPPEEIEQSITARFDRQVADAPRRVAVKTRNHAWTYEELNARADRIARAVLDRRALHGATRDARPDENFAQERVALLFEHDAPMIAALIAALKAGDTYVPLDPLYPKERLRAILSDASAHVLLTGGAHAELALALAADSALHVIDVDALEEYAHAGRVSMPTPPEAVACLLYSSGSTGRPKGTMQSHRHIMHVVSGYTNNLHVSADDRLTLFSSYSHVAAMTDIYASLLNGAALYPFDVKTEGAEPLARWVKEEGITIYHSVPTLYRHFVETLAPSERFERLRAVVLGGEEVFEKDVELFRRHFPPECVFVNMYGSTETTVNLMYMIGNDGGRVRSPVPVGYPVGSNEVFLLNEAGGRAQVYGEIAVRSPYVAAGYWREPEGVASGGFSPDPEGVGKRVYRTGDFGRRLSDGSLVLLGRKDFQVKIRGFRVELGEIESALGEHPGVKTAVAAALEVGLGEKRIVAYAVPENSDGELTPAGLRDHLKERVPSYMMPAAFMILDSVPLTPNGKVNRKALPEPDWSGLELERGYVAPRSETEQEVARIWGDVLRLERISVNDSFFDLGGHSLLATQLIARLRKAFMMELPLRRLFESPTVAGVAEVIESGRREGNGPKVSAPAIMAASREGRRYKKNM